MTKYKFYIETGLIEAEIEEEFTVEEFGYSEKEWEALSDTEKEIELNNQLEEFIYNNVSSGYHKVEKEEN